jgi:nicotinamidase-related amidase
MVKKALIIMDMQIDLCYDSRRKEKVKRMIGPLKEIINLFSKRNHDIYYICLSLPPNDEQFDRFGDRYCIEGSEGAKIIPELFPLKGPIITKKKHSAFFETSLDDYLKKSQIKETYFAGLQTQICIMTSVADANFRGYRPIVIEECVISTREKNKRDALEWIKKYVGEVNTIQEINQVLRDG